MKNIVALLCVLVGTSAFAWPRAIKKMTGDVHWNRGNWSCSATNVTGRTLEVKGARFEGDTRRGASASVFVGKKAMLNDGDSITVVKRSIGSIDYVRNCSVIYYK